ncbi:MAG: hypothetical protein HQL43_04370 [Alphaproteobacteria bacterium]|nr:hypothetical protein [Alphaproteobacteria bacterium]
MKRYYFLGFMLYAFCFSAVILSLVYDTVKRDIAKLEGERREVSKKIAPLEAWLQSNRGVYAQGACQAPYRPNVMCSTEHDARARAVVKCGFQWEGCAGVAKLLNGKGDSPVMGYVANVGCSSITAEMRGENYSEADFAIDTLEAIAESYCKNDGGFLSGMACLFSTLSKLEKKRVLLTCIEDETEQCYGNFTRWKAASDKYSSCLYVVDRVSAERRVLQGIEDRIEKLRKGFVYTYLGGLTFDSKGRIRFRN